MCFFVVLRLRDQLLQLYFIFIARNILLMLHDLNMSLFFEIIFSLLEVPGAKKKE